MQWHCWIFGCGEDYYIAELAARLELRYNVAVYGLDTTKVAICYAVKRYLAVSLFAWPPDTPPACRLLNAQWMRYYASIRAMQGMANWCEW